MSGEPKGPSVPIPPYKGTRHDPTWAWLFAKGIYGPPDLRPAKYELFSPWIAKYTREQARSWFGRDPYRGEFNER